MSCRGYVFALLISLCCTVFAAEGEQLPSNVGFKVNPSAALVARYPMCDAFLDVKWLRPDLGVGLSHHDVYIGDERVRTETSVVTVYGQEPLFSINAVSTNVRPGKEPLAEHLEFFRSEISRHSETGNSGVYLNDFDIKMHSEDRKVVYYFSRSDGTDRESLSNNRLNVCVELPNSQRVWLAELRQLRWALSETEIAALAARVDTLLQRIPGVNSESSDMPITTFWMRTATALDLNGDGETDYVYNGQVIYSANKFYFEILRGTTRDIGPEDFKWTFPPSNQKCREIFGRRSGYLLTTDGADYFVFGHCNLRELTRPAPRKNLKQ